MSPPDISRSSALLFPPFAQRVAAGLEEARAAGLDVHLFEGWRSPARQSALYAAGRTKPGPKVTNSQAWESWHQYGLAVDVVFGGPGRWSWSGDWPALRRIMSNVGLRALPWEQPHFEWPTTLKVGAALELTRAEGLLSLWQRIETTYKVS